nr:hypothetical protein [Escherichia coli]
MAAIFAAASPPPRRGVLRPITIADGSIFAGRVTDISCSIALNGGQHAGSGNVWLAPVSSAEVHDRGAGAFMKPQPFTPALSNCQLRHDGGAASQDEVRRVSVRWVDGFFTDGGR